MPDVLGTIVRGVLQDASLAYTNGGLIASEVYPKLKMPTIKSKIYTFSRGDQFRDEAVKRAPGDVTPTFDYHVSSQNFDAYQWASAHSVTKEEMREAGLDNYLKVPVDMQMEAIERNSAKLDLKVERLVAANVTGATWADGNVGGEDADAKWVASTGNTFLTDVDTGINALRAGGVDISSIRLALDFKTWQGVRKNGDIADRTANTKAAFPTPEDMASYLGLEKIVIAGGIYSTANEKADNSDFTTADIWGGANNKGFAMVYHYPKRVGRKTMSAGYIPWVPMENKQERATYKDYDKKAHEWRYESQTEVGVKQVAAPAAYAWKDTHTT